METLLRKRFKKIIVIGILFSIVFIICSIILTSFINRLQTSSLQTQLYNHAEDDRTSINLHIDANFQLLQTLGAFLEANDLINSSSFAYDLDRANYKNDFQRMSVFNLEGTGTRVTLSYEIETDILLSDMPEDFQTIVEEAFKGNNAISQVYTDDLLNEQVISYAVPIYQNDTLVGALTGTEYFTEISSIFTVSTDDKQKVVDLIDKDGNVLVLSNNKIVQEDVKTIYEKNHFSQIEEINNAMQHNQSIFVVLSYNGKSYQALFEPVGINDWYFIVLDPSSGTSLPYYSSINIMQIVLGSILLVLIIFLLYTYFILIRNNRNLTKLAYYDELTGLYNQTKFNECIIDHHVLKHDGAFIVLNIRQFRFINRMLGSIKCDQLLCHCAQVLRKNMKEGEYCCHDTADQFTIYIKDTDPTIIKQRLTTIFSQIQDYSELQRQNFSLHLYAAVRIKKEDENDLRHIYNQVMFTLKKARVNPACNFLFFDETMHKEATEQLYIETHMQEALSSEQFQLFLQPKYKVDDLSIQGIEAKVKWIRNHYEVLPPSSFLSVFEENGFSVHLDTYLFEQLCKTMQEWKEKGKLIPFSINHSKAMFYQPNYTNILYQITERYRIPREYITIELYEHVVADNLHDVNIIFDQLHAYGFQVSIDHFGNGYSSLNMLGNMHIDELKFDRSFLQEWNNKTIHQNHVIKIMMDMAQDLSLRTVIEGVESMEDMETLVNLNADYAQGDYLQAAKPMQEIYRLL